MAARKKTEMITTGGKEIVDFTSWPTRSEVAARLSCSVSKVRALQRDGSLTAHCDAEGTHRYSPEEVAMLASEMNDQVVAVEIEAADLKMASKLVTSMTGPRNQLDSLLMRTIERQEARIERLEAELDKARDAAQRGLDREAERKVEAVQAVANEKRKNMLAEAAVEHVSRFLGGKKDSSFLESLKIEQLEALADCEGWTDQQERSLRAHLAKKKLSQEEPARAALEQKGMI